MNKHRFLKMFSIYVTLRKENEKDADLWKDEKTSSKEADENDQLNFSLPIEDHLQQFIVIQFFKKTLCFQFSGKSFMESYYKPAQSYPHTHSKIHFNITFLTRHMCSCCLFHTDLPIIIPHAFFVLAARATYHTHHVHHTFLRLTTPAQKIERTNFRAPHYIVFYTTRN
jgi:hypothetical protein